MIKSFLIVTSFIFSINLCAKEVGPCKADIEKFCKGMKRGDGKIVKCLKEHESELSPECKAKRADIKAKIREYRDVCKEDRIKYCKDVKPGKGRVRDCMKTNTDKLTPECKAQVEKLK